APARRSPARDPATSANLGPGFDCLGLALDLWASITVGSDSPKAGRDPMASMAAIAARNVFDQTGFKPEGAFGAHYEGDIPISRGLGASAIARVGGALAA